MKAVILLFFISQAWGIHVTKRPRFEKQDRKKQACYLEARNVVNECSSHCFNLNMGSDYKEGESCRKKCSENYRKTVSNCLN